MFIVILISEISSRDFELLGGILENISYEFCTEKVSVYRARETERETRRRQYSIVKF